MENPNMRRYSGCFTHYLLLLGAWTLATQANAAPPAVSVEQTKAEIKKPIGPDDLPHHLPGRWKVSLCVCARPSHAWIRYQNLDTGEIRSIGRYHVLVGGWFDGGRIRYHYAPTWRPGLYMDREQRYEDQVRKGKCLLLSVYQDDPQIFLGEIGSHGYGLVVNNCATYARDAWHFYSGEKYSLPEIHTPDELLKAVLQRHPEVRATNQEPQHAAP